MSDKHDAPGISLATFRGEHRSLANTERVYAVGIDLDHDVPPWDDLVHLFGGSAALIHTTWTSTDEHRRVRVVLLLSRPVTAEEYPRVLRAVSDRAKGRGLTLDPSAKDASRFWYLYSAPTTLEALNEELAKKELPLASALPEPRAAICTGKPVNVDWALITVPAAPPPPPPPSTRSGDADDRVVERARRWLAMRDPAIQGSNGDRWTFETVQSIVRGFDLDDATAYALLAQWNLTCRPPWDERGLRRKIREARERGRMPLGELRDAPRRSA